MANAEVVTREVVKNKLKEPKRYKVIILNDNYTTAEFVVELLILVFKHPEEVALIIMQNVHEKGAGIAGTYTYEIAEQKCIEATNLARENGHPLVIKAEAE